MWRKNALYLIRTSAGFTLPEVMVGGAIMAGVALAGATLLKNQADSQKRLNADQSLMMFHSTLTKTLENPHHCNATFKFKYGEAITSELVIPAIELCGANCNLDADAGTVTKSATPFFTAGDFIKNTQDNRQYWKLSDIRTKNALNKTGVARLIFTYDDVRPPGRKVYKEALVNLRFSNDGKLMECFNDQESSVNNLSNDLCKSLGNDLVVWNEETQKCELKDAVEDCSEHGKMVVGISSTGEVTCRDVGQGFDPVGSFDDRQATCEAGSNAKTIILPNGKLGVICE
jgi:type II secretory pathway pseudopilin PulG